MQARFQIMAHEDQLPIYEFLLSFYSLDRSQATNIVYPIVMLTTSLELARGWKSVWFHFCFVRRFLAQVTLLGQLK